MMYDFANEYMGLGSIRQNEAPPAEAQAQIEANIDALTGVKNRHAFLAAEERVETVFERADQNMYENKNDLKERKARLRKSAD